MKQTIKLVEFPKEWVYGKSKKHFDIYCLEVNGRCDVLRDLFKCLKNDKKDFKSLLSTINMQLESEQLLENKKRLVKGKKYRKILEFKSPHGHSRLLGFIDTQNSRIIICTNFYWKTTGKKQKQDETFSRAEHLRITYLNCVRRGFYYV